LIDFSSSRFFLRSESGTGIQNKLITETPPRALPRKDTLMTRHFAFGAYILALSLLTLPAKAMTNAEDACIDQLRAVGGPDGASGTVLSSQFSEAETLVMLQDAGGTTWRCIAYKDGSIGDLAVVDATDDGGGAMAGSDSAASTTNTERVRFDAGTSGTEITASLTPGSSTRYVLGAKDGQFLYVRVAAQGKDISYQIFNPDNSFLLDQVSSAQEYRGQLWQSGDHVIEVINRGGSTSSYNVIFGIE
jgi:hypothetical protein